MGAHLSNLVGHSTQPDPATGLSPRDKHLVASSWALAKKNVRETGLRVFELLFSNAEVKEMFSFARGKSWSEIAGDPRLAAHINAVMYAITALVDHIEEVQVLDAMLRKMADNHAARSITIKEFEILGPILIQALTDKLGTRVMSKDTSEAWGKVYGIILQIVKDQMYMSTE